MFNLVYNEIQKYFLRPFTYIFFSLLFLLMLFTFALAPKIFDYDYGGDRIYSNNWKKEAKNDIAKYSKTLYEAKKSKDSLNKDIIMKKEFLPVEIRRLKAHLDENVHPPAPNNVFSKLFNTTSFLPIVLIFLIVYSGSIVSQEFHKGTIKTLLISPYSRSSILFSKYFSIVLVSGISILIMYLFMGGISLVTSHMNPSTTFIYFDLNTNKMTKIAFLPEFLKFIANDFFFALIVSTIAFALSTLLLNTSMSISISLGFYFLSEIIIDFISNKFSFVKWLWFSNWNMNIYSGIMDSKVIDSTSFVFSLCYDIVLILLLLIISFLSFNKRDITI